MQPKDYRPAIIKTSFRQIIIIILFTVNLIACRQAQERSDPLEGQSEKYPDHVRSMTLEVQSTKRFAIDQATSYQTLFLTVYHDEEVGKRYLAYQNRENNCIQFYGFETEVMEKEICFPKDGPNSIRKLAGFKVINFDSIYVIDKNSKSLGLFDRHGTKKRSYSLLHGPESNKTSMAMAFTQTSFILLENDSIYLPAFPDRSPYYLGYPFVAVSLSSGNYEYVGRYTDYYSNPDYDWNENLFGDFFSYCLNSNTNGITFSFQGDPYIYTGHPRNPLQNKYLARSDKFYGTKPPATKKEKLSSEEYFISMNYYRNIAYDPYRDLYYRTVSHRTDLLKADMTRNKIEDKPMSIIILNADFEKVGEVYLPPDKYFFRTMFVEKEGLYISTAHYANPDLKEDQIEFDVFQPVPILQ